MTRLEKIAFDVIEDHFNGVLPLLSVKLRLYKRILAALKAQQERAKRMAREPYGDERGERLAERIASEEE